jgi:hypothetical protein
MAGPKRIYFPDEEPEEEFIPYEHWRDAVRGLCAYCGHEGHQKIDCPHRPL